MHIETARSKICKENTNRSGEENSFAPMSCNDSGASGEVAGLRGGNRKEIGQALFLLSSCQSTSAWSIIAHSINDGNPMRR